MGEYRQQAAKEMGVGPSEMDTVNRAQQGMPQGGPRMPQGAPQQMPQQPQGVMSQARPVQLAGGGIVAFANGSEDEGPVKEYPDLSDSFAALIPEFLRGTKSEIQAKRRENPVQKSIERAIREESRERSAEQMDELFENVSLDDMLPAAEDAPASGIMLAGAPDRELKPKVVPPAGADTTAEGIAGDGGKDAPLSLREQQQRVLDQITSMAEIEPYQRDQDLTAMLKNQMARNPGAEGRAAIERIKELSGLEEGRRMLEAQRSRLREDYESATPSGTARFMDLISTPGGLRTIGRRGAQMRRQEAKRRQEFTAGLANIDNTAIELQKSVGTSAANNYETAAKTAQGAINSATSTLQQADAAGRSDYVERVKLRMSSKQSLMSHLENLSRDEQAVARAALDRKQITSNNALGVLRASETSISQASERMRKREEDIEATYRMAIFGAQEDPVKLAKIDEEIREKVTLANADDITLIRGANSRLQEASEVLSGQGASMEVADSEDFATYAQK
tara:strand:- start:1271 stop:2797 length:1527 start_codon:yes stop_codon:yes gene_type:complete